MLSKACTTERKHTNMKKLFAIILAMALLLCGAAMADEAATEISAAGS